MATTPDTPAGDSLRDALDAAFLQHASDEPDSDKAAPDAPVEPAAGGDAAAAAAKGEAASPAVNDASGRARDAGGRFAAKDAQRPGEVAPPPPAGAQAAGAAQPSQAPQPGGELKAPAAWKPQAREKWASVDPEVRAEVQRREWEFQHTLQEAAQARQFAQQFERMVQPYSLFIAQENSTPLQAVQNLMQTAASLRMGSPQSKAQLVAAIIEQHGIDVGMLDTLLAGKPVATQQQQFRDPRLDQFLAAQAQQQQVQQQATAREVAQTLQQFGDTHEFYGDVATTMADLFEIRSRQGQPADLEKIYAQACQMHEGVATILAQRATAKTNASSSAAVLRAKRAAASVKGDTMPADGSSVPRDDSIRAAIEAAIESSGRA